MAARCFSSGNLFRGQTDASWGLIPGLYRRDVAIQSEGLSKAKLYLIAEERMLESFFDRAAMLLPNFQRSPLMDRFVAQHFGVPTQLLDWTVDPFIALFFAVWGGNPERDRALFYINPLSGLNKGIRSVNLPWEGKVTSVRPPVVDDRVRSQKSVFTLQSFGSATEFVPLDKRTLKVSKEGEGTHSTDEVLDFGKVVIPADKCPQILYQLLELGIDSSLVYPGLAGIGQRIADVAKLQNYGGREP